MRAIAAEFQKVFTTRMWWLLAILMFVYVAALAGGLGAFFGWITDDPEAAAQAGTTTTGPVPSGADLGSLLFSFATSIGYVFPVLLGALAVTGEFRHQTLTPTFLATPHRSTVLGAKFVSQLVLGAAFGVVAFVGTVAAASGALAAWGIDAGLDSSDTWALIGRGILAMALWGAIGVGLGAVVPNQVAAIVIVIAFTQFLEPVLRFIAALSEPTAQIGRFLPGAASDALVGASFYTLAASAGGSGVDPLEWWQGGLVLAGIAVVLTVIGGATTWRRDVS
ncbi:ABC transporter permease subunit [Agromyces sp. LHK192]|uniref:ABC transporter permease subunit n=1 Tax=Agromyces sp. LHK192 TaxID=2498704 RepID=UPI000FD7545F|nr:ABC transporter permease subunit [Agromyces sp. LHK192]